MERHRERQRALEELEAARQAVKAAGGEVEEEKVWGRSSSDFAFSYSLVHTNNAGNS